MKKTLTGILFFAFMMHISAGEPKQYTGTLVDRQLNATLTWLDDNTVTGVATSPDAPDRKLVFSGKNSAAGLIKLSIIEDSETVGTVTLKKLTSEASIIWSGIVKFADGTTGVLELRRPR